MFLYRGAYDFYGPSGRDNHMRKVVSRVQRMAGLSFKVVTQRKTGQTIYLYEGRHEIPILPPYPVHSSYVAPTETRKLTYVIANDDDDQSKWVVDAVSGPVRSRVLHGGLDKTFRSPEDAAKALGSYLKLAEAGKLKRVANLKKIANHVAQTFMVQSSYHQLERELRKRAPSSPLGARPEEVAAYGMLSALLSGKLSMLAEETLIDAVKSGTLDKWLKEAGAYIARNGGAYGLAGSWMNQKVRT
jgi:hypothetical protein